MSELKRLSRVAKECNVGIQTIVEFLHKKGFPVENNPNAKIPPEALLLVMKEYQSDLAAKKEAEQFKEEHKYETRTSISIDDTPALKVEEEPEQEDMLLIQDTRTSSTYSLLDQEPAVKEKRAVKTEPEVTTIGPAKSAGPKVVGKVELEKPKKKKVEKGEKIEEVEEVAKDEGTGISEGEASVATVKEEPEEEVMQLTQAKDLIGEVKVVGKIDIDALNQKTRPSKKFGREKEAGKPGAKGVAEKEGKPTEEAAAEKEARGEPRKPAGTLAGPEHKVPVGKLAGPTVVGRIDLPEETEKKKEKITVTLADDIAKKKKRKRIRKDKVSLNEPITERETVKVGKKKAKVKKKITKVEISEEDVQRQIKDTLAKMTPKGKSKASKHRRIKREQIRQSAQAEAEQAELDSHTIQVTEFVTANELANMMNVQVNEIISTCMSLGLFVSINQRLDAETISVVADEFGFEVEFISVEVQEAIEQEVDEDDELLPRPPIVTVMGHVDHGKTSLLDYIRKTNIIAGEAGGITQHIGAYKVVLENGKTITFLDTPGHEAFTAMRARGAQGADLAIIVIAADDAVMPQTIEAINHAAAAGVPMVFALNKIDKEGANPEKIKEQLSGMNYLVEDWGGKYQSQEISAKKGKGVHELLEKVLLEAEILDLKANPYKNALGTVIESSLDKGRGFVATILVQAGTLRVGDILLAGSYFGRIKAMFNERGNPMTVAGPSEPVLVLGLNGAPQAGDKFHVLESEREAREIATKREQLQREQDIRTRKHITLDEIGRRIAIGNFQELNIIVKGDVDGSIEALSDSLIKLSTPEIQVNIIHKAVGQISESDVLLATASNAIVVGFQVRPSLSARKLADKEGIEIRLYSIIYDAINEIKAAMEGMLSPEIKEEIIGTLEVLEAFKITKVGTVAGCIVRDGKIVRSAKVRVIRDGIVVYDGLLGSLKRFKDDAKEVVSGLECGLNIENYNDIKVGDVIEPYISKEIKKTL